MIAQDVMIVFAFASVFALLVFGYVKSIIMGYKRPFFGAFQMEDM